MLHTCSRDSDPWAEAPSGGVHAPPKIQKKQTAAVQRHQLAETASSATPSAGHITRQQGQLAPAVETAAEGADNPV